MEGGELKRRWIKWLPPKREAAGSSGPFQPCSGRLCTRRLSNSKEEGEGEGAKIFGSKSTLQWQKSKRKEKFWEDEKKAVQFPPFFQEKRSWQFEKKKSGEGDWKRN